MASPLKPSDLRGAPRFGLNGLGVFDVIFILGGVVALACVTFRWGDQPEAIRGLVICAFTIALRARLRVAALNAEAERQKGEKNT